MARKGLGDVFCASHPREEVDCPSVPSDRGLVGITQSGKVHWGKEAVPEESKMKIYFCWKMRG